MVPGEPKNPGILNLWTLAGLIVCITSAGIIFVLLITEMIVQGENPYLGILMYFALPLLLLVGVALLLTGRAKAKRKQQIHPENPELYPVLNLNDRPQRRFVIFVFSVSLGLVAVMAVVAVKAYEFSESPTFCGYTCHFVMGPEHTAWSRSAHARVRCVECHVGPGAEHFIRSKLAGVRQLYGVVTGTFSRPIPTPVETLRPSTETCENCHWPWKMYYEKTKVYTHFAQDRNNTPREIRLLLKIGGEFVTAPKKGRIHWHIGREVGYIARDDRRQDIPYVYARHGDRTVEYYDESKPPTAEQLLHGERRVIDCIDCHNRPTHIFRAPGTEIDRSFILGRLDPTLPYLKKIGMEALARDYRTKEEGLAGVTSAIRTYYAQYPTLAWDKRKEIKQAEDEIRYIYDKNFFPEMKVNWKTHTDNLGHFYFPGCFRCHDGKHKSRDGRVIPSDCDLCHHIVGQTQENIPPGTQVTDFIHPVDIGDELYSTNCSDCHTPLESKGGERK